MPYQPLHHKYRPQTFAELVGQQAIATTLTNAIATRRIAPAYLFTGPRGTGKTSSARILAKSLNCLSSEEPTPAPCGQCEVCRAIARGAALDVIEIDAASNTGVDNIREIIERAQFAPVQCRYKVYVIDECHMLSQAAFNALLKTLEEPPERVIFVLATTDPQRVLPTIISRCQRFDYRRIPIESMASHLENIAGKEKIDITDQAIALVAQIANGGLRDAQSLLDQLSLLSGTITVERVWDLVGAVPERDLLTLLQAIDSNKAEAVIEQCRNLMNRGREPLVVLQNLANFYLQLLIAKTAPNRPDMSAVTTPTWKELCEQAKQWEIDRILQAQQHLKDSEVQLKNTNQPRLWLEVTLLGLLPSAHSSGRSVKQMQVSTPAPSPRRQPSAAPPPPTELREASRRLHRTEGLSDRKGVQMQESPDAEIDRSRKEEKITSAKANWEQNQLQPPVQPTAQTSETERHQVQPQSQQPEASPVEDSPAPGETVSAKMPAAEPVSPAQIWQQVLEHIQLNATQALLRDHCHLTTFEGHLACISVKNKTLFDIAQKRLPNIEAAFEAVCNHKVKVNLKVATPGQFQETAKHQSAKQQIQPAPSKPIASSVTKKIPNQPSQLTAKLQPTAETTPTPTLPTLSQPSEISEHTTWQDTQTPISPEDNQENPGTSDSHEDLNRAAESLAQCFNGEIIILSDRIDNEKPEALPEPSTANDLIQSEPKALPVSDLELETSGQQLDRKNKPIIRGRPDVTDFNSEDDIPFVRSISLGTWEVNLQDSWELEANRPGIWLRGARDLWL